MNWRSTPVPKAFSPVHHLMFGWHSSGEDWHIWFLVGKRPMGLLTARVDASWVCPDKQRAPERPCGQDDDVTASSAVLEEIGIMYLLPGI